MNECLEKLLRQRAALDKAIAEEEEKAKQPAIGSLDWAIERMREGEKVHRPDWIDKTARIYMDILNRIIWESDNGEHFVWNLDDWKSPISDEYRASGWQIYEPKPQYKVGDWVVCKYTHKQGKTNYEKVIEVTETTIATIASDGSVTEYDANGNHGDIMGWHIERVVKPHEVVLDFGNGINGRIELEQDTGWITVYEIDEEIASISIETLTEPIKSQVIELLKAQEEEK